MRSISAVVSIAGISVLAAGCGGGGGGDSSDVKSAISAFVEQHDCAKATPALRKTLVGETDVGKCSHLLGLRNKVKSLKVSSVKVDGKNATAKVVTDGQTVPATLVKQDGKWLLSDVGTSTARKPAPTAQPGAPPKNPTYAPGHYPDYRNPDAVASDSRQRLDVSLYEKPADYGVTRGTKVQLAKCGPYKGNRLKDLCTYLLTDGKLLVYQDEVKPDGSQYFPKYVNVKRSR